MWVYKKTIIRDLEHTGWNEGLMGTVECSDSEAGANAGDTGDVSLGHSWKESVYGKYEWVFGDRGWAGGNTGAYTWEKKAMSKLPMECMTEKLMGESARSKCQRKPHSHLHQCLMNFMQITSVYLTKACFFCSPAQAIKACESCPGHLTSVLGQLPKDTQGEGGWKTNYLSFGFHGKLG